MKTRFKTDQAIFNFVRTRLLKQNKKSIDSNIVIDNMLYKTCCVYRGKEGRRCAVGWLITDSNYNGGIEGKRIDDQAVRDALNASGVQLPSEGLECNSTFKLLDQLQLVHDERKPYTWETAFKQFHFDAYGKYIGYGKNVLRDL